jgi:translation initiation factor IF-2
MSDNNSSGADVPANSSAAPAETPSATPAEATGSFGATRGSGLARGKRSHTAAPSAAPAAPRGDYQPTAIQVVVAQREYQNPFSPGETETPPAPVPAPAAVVVAPVAPVAPAPVAAPQPQPAPAPVAVATPPAASAAPTEKAQLTILPPAETKRPETRWDSDSSAKAPAPQGRREDRPVFRAERPASAESSFGEQAAAQPAREGRRDGRGPRENRPHGRGGEREPRPAPAAGSTFKPQRPPAPEAKSGGFIGWLKGLFGGSSAEAPKAGGRGDSPREGGPEGQRRRQDGRRGRGGFEGRGPRPQGEGSPRPQGQEGGGEGGGRRRRHRGGRGRGRGEGGGEGRGPGGPSGT